MTEVTEKMIFLVASWKHGQLGHGMYVSYINWE